jgi:hypothetical protein
MNKKTGWLWRTCVAAVMMGTSIALGAQEGFPFDQEILLDVDRLPDSKRVPILEVRPDGSASIDLWCKSGPGQVMISGADIKIILGAMQAQYCTPERLARDAVLAVELSEVTQWRRDDDKIILLGPTTLRYRLSTH